MVIENSENELVIKGSREELLKLRDCINGALDICEIIQELKESNKENNIPQEWAEVHPFTALFGNIKIGFSCTGVV